jgi:D-alanine-D-alanine ligase
MINVPLDFPLFIKPTDRGGGLGVDSDSVVHGFDQLRTKVHSITTTFRSDALIEEYLPGREFSVAILKYKNSAGYLAMPIELVAPADKNGSRLLSGQVKSENVEQVLEVTDTIVRSKVITLALAVFDALGARDYGRIDIRLDNNGTPHFLEANLIPSLISGYGSFPKACLLNIGLDYEPMIMTIANLALARNVNEIVDVPELVMMSSSVLQSSEIVFAAA